MVGCDIRLHQQLCILGSMIIPENQDTESPFQVDLVTVLLELAIVQHSFCKPANLTKGFVTKWTKVPFHIGNKTGVILASNCDKMG